MRYLVEVFFLEWSVAAKRFKGGFRLLIMASDRSARKQDQLSDSLRLHGGGLDQYLFIWTETIWRSSSLMDFRSRRFPIFGIRWISPPASVSLQIYYGSDDLLKLFLSAYKI